MLPVYSISRRDAVFLLTWTILRWRVESEIEISWRTGKKLRFDDKTETFDDKDANQFVGREHRKGFELPKIV